MKVGSGKSERKARVIGARIEMPEAVRRPRWIAGLGELLAVSFAVSAACLLMTGCGQEKTATARVESNAQSSSSPQAASTSAVVANSTSGAPAAVTTGALVTGSEHDGLPPEIAIGEVDTLVAPGQPLQLTIYGTPDVTSMSLADGIGKPEPLVHDASGDVWRVSYRVPLRPKQDRIGLSVTAQNDLNRWRRVWIFLRVQSPGTVAKSEPDSVVQH
jgi:hypothetical protein